MNTNTGNADIKTQEKNLLEYMKTHKGVTRLIAMRLGIANGPEIIRRLKMAGHVIGDEWVVEDDKRHKVYYLIREAEA